MELRAWQKNAMPLLWKAWEKKDAGVVRAATGSGKSLLLAILTKRIAQHLSDFRQKIVITAPKVGLIYQLKKTFQSLGFSASTFFEMERSITSRIIIACHGSLDALIEDFKLHRIETVVWVADECHGTESATLRRWSSFCQGAWRLGFTATPHRATDTERLRLYSKLIFEYTAEDALRDGVIVPYKLITGKGETDWTDKACVQRIKEEPSIRGLPGLVSAYSISDAVSFASLLSRSGVKASAIHSKQNKIVQMRLLYALKAGQLDCLVHVNLLTEGADLPWLRWLCLRRAAKNTNASRNRFIQEVGRVLRKSDGKDKAIILDPHNLFHHLRLTYAAVLGQELDAPIRSIRVPKESIQEKTKKRIAYPKNPLEESLHKLSKSLEKTYSKPPKVFASIQESIADGRVRDAKLSIHKDLAIFIDRCQKKAVLLPESHPFYRDTMSIVEILVSAWIQGKITKKS